MGTIESALNFLEGRSKQLISDLDALLRFDTSMPPGHGYPALVAHLEERLRPLGFEFKRVVVPERLWWSERLSLAGERTNLVATRERGHPPLSIYAHLDVVPAGEGWRHPPFAATFEDGYLYGRGASDMKGSIASLIGALEAVHEADLELRFDPLLLFCSDEEGGTYPGIRYLAEQGYLKGHLLCLDGHAAPRIWAGCCGLIDMNITVEGRAGHTGNPGGTVNAFEEALPILNALMVLKEKVEARRSAMPAPPGASDPHIHAHLSLTMARSGVKSTSIPSSFDFYLNRRYLPEEMLDEVVAELEEVIHQAAAAGRAQGVHTVVTAHLPPVRNPLGPHWPRWQGALGRGFGYHPEDFALYGAGSSSDMGWVQATGSQEILLGGVSRADNNVHGANERVAITDLRNFARALLIYLSAEFGPKIES